MDWNFTKGVVYVTTGAILGTQVIFFREENHVPHTQSETHRTELFVPTQLTGTSMTASGENSPTIYR